jgi:hypothetical protein
VKPAPAKAETSAATTADASHGTTTQPGDAEDLAASLLADEAKPAAPTEPPKTVTTTCPYCDEEVKFDAALAGKQAPCPNPECRRIIKVPALTKQEKIDWRSTTPGLPTGARRPTEPAPEGAWGSTSKTVVSKEALQEADALPVRRQPITWAGRIRRGLLACAALVLVGLGALWAVNWLGGKKQEKMLGKALAAASQKDGPVKGEGAAVVHYAAGLYHLRRDDRDTVKPDKGDAGSVSQFGLARARLQAAADNPECDAMLIELALAQVGLAGGPEQVGERKRLSWKDTGNELRSTLQAIRAPEAQAEGLRRVTRKLVEKGQAELAEALAAHLGGGPGPLAIVGLEFLRAGDTERAQKVLERMPRRPEKAKGAKDEPATPLTADAVAFLVAQGREKDIPDPKNLKEADQKDMVQAGRAAGLAWLKRPDEAYKEAGKARAAAWRLEALVAIADAPGDDAAVKAAVEAAADQAEKSFGTRGAPAWPVLRLVPIGLRVGVAEDALLALAARVSGKDRVRGWAQLPVCRARLAREGGPADPSLADPVEKGTLAHGLALVELARHNARKNASAGDAVEGWDESLRPFGYAGTALGLQGGD